MKRLLLILLATACAGPVVAQERGGKVNPGYATGQGEVRFAVLPADAVERRLVEMVSPALKDAPMKSSLYDIDEDGSAEALIRVEAEKECDAGMKRCRTLVFKNVGSGWRQVLDRRAETVSFGVIGFGGMRKLAIDGGRESFAWSGNRYRFDLSAMGRPVEFTTASEGTRLLLAAQFGDGARLLAQRNPGVQVSVASIAPKDKGGAMVLARLDGPGVCGSVLGCPWRLLQVKDKAYKVVSKGVGGTKAALLQVARGDGAAKGEGWRDIGFETPAGFRAYGWAGDKYVLVETVKEDVQ